MFSVRGLRRRVVHKQSYSGEGFGGSSGMLMKAMFEGTTNLEDDTKEKIYLTEEFRRLNAFFRGSMGGGGPGGATITTPDGAQIVTHPNDVIRVADAVIKDSWRRYNNRFSISFASAGRKEAPVAPYWVTSIRVWRSERLTN